MRWLTLPELIALDHQYGDRLFSSDLLDFYRDLDGRPFYLYRRTAPDTPEIPATATSPAIPGTYETSDHVDLANIYLRRLYHRPDSLFRAHLVYLELNKPEDLKKQEREALAKSKEKPERFKPHGTVGWTETNNQLYRLERAIVREAAIIVSALKAEHPKPERIPHAYSESEESKVADLFTEDGYDEEAMEAEEAALEKI